MDGPAIDQRRDDRADGLVGRAGPDAVREVRPAGLVRAIADVIAAVAVPVALPALHRRPRAALADELGGLGGTDQFDRER